MKHQVLLTVAHTKRTFRIVFHLTKRKLKVGFLMLQVSKKEQYDNHKKSSSNHLESFLWINIQKCTEQTNISRIYANRSQPNEKSFGWKRKIIWRRMRKSSVGKSPNTSPKTGKDRLRTACQEPERTFRNTFGNYQKDPGNALALYRNDTPCAQTDRPSGKKAA